MNKIVRYISARATPDLLYKIDVDAQSPNIQSRWLFRNIVELPCP